MANLVEALLKADASKVNEYKTGVFKSQRLADVLDLSEPVDVEIREIPARRFKEIAGMQVDKAGNFDASRVFDAELLVALDGVTSPDLRDKKLREHFGAATPKDLAEKLFGNEIDALSEAISILSGVDEDTSKKDEDVIKN